MENYGDTHRWDKEGNPAHHDKHGGGEVDGEDEGAEGSAEKNLKPVSTVVAWVKRSVGQSKNQSLVNLLELPTKTLLCGGKSLMSTLKGSVRWFSLGFKS